MILLSQNVTIGEGSIICARFTATCDIEIGHSFHGNIGGLIEHDCRVGDFVTFSPGAICNGNVIIENNVFIGSGAIIRNGDLERPLVIGGGFHNWYGGCCIKRCKTKNNSGRESRKINKRKFIMTDLRLPKWPEYQDDEIDSVRDVLSSGKVNYWTGDICNEFEVKFSQSVGCNFGIA